MKISYNWLKAYVPDIPEPNRLAELFTYHVCEVESYEKLALPPLSPSDSSPQAGEQDWLFDLGILPDRAHDLLSHQGVARELCGLLGVQFKDPTPMYKTPVSHPTKLMIDVQSDKARRYAARIIRSVKVGPSPDWMKKHLESIGQRSINNIVDATNIIMYDRGQPTHAFDLRRIHPRLVEEGAGGGGPSIIIRNATEGDTMKLVGREGTVVTLKESDLVIADGTSHNLALGGVKGGADSGVSDDTTDILIEVANFDPVSTRKTARGLGLFTDAAKRFENDLSPTLCAPAMFDLSALLIELFPEAIFEDIVDVYPFKGFEEKRTIFFTSEFISKKLGITIPEAEIERILKNYSYVYAKEKDVYAVEVPPLRLDLTIPEDMVEEIGRVYGYDKVIPVLPKIDFTPEVNPVYEKMRAVRQMLVADGYREVMTYAFANTGEVEVLASASDKKFLRTNLTDGLKKSYEMNKLNLPLIGGTEVKIFEIGTVFKNDSEEIHVGYADKKEVKEMKLENFEYTPSASGISPLAGGEGSDPLLVKEGAGGGVFHMWSIYPFITRDIAVWVPETVTADTLKEIYIEFGTELLQGEPTLFDQFTKEGRTSYAFRLVFQAYDRTLTDDEVAVIMSHIVEKLTSFGYEVR
jgi:phenylalanyl-tRNA synthetase beta chain